MAIKFELVNFTVARDEVIMVKLKEKVTLEIAAKLLMAIKKAFPNNQALVLCQDTDISAISEKTMNNMGWFKKKK